MPATTSPPTPAGTAVGAVGYAAYTMTSRHDLTAAPRKQLQIYPGAAHGVALVTPAGAPRTLVERFLRGR